MSSNADRGAPRRAWLHLFPRQLAALARKNLLTRWRDWQLNLSNVAQAVLFVLLIWVVDRAVGFSNQQAAYLRTERHPEPVAVGGIPACRTDAFLKPAECLTLLYSPAGDPLVERLMADVRAGNVPPLSAEEVRGFADPQQVDEWLWENPGRASAAVHFTMEGPQALRYVVQSNSSVRFFKGSYQDPTSHVALPLQVSLEAAFARLALNRSDLPWQVSFQDFPHPQLAENSRTGRIAPVFVLASLMFNFVAQLAALAQEAEGGGRRALAAAGMLDSAYWASAALVEVLLAALQASLIVLTAWALRFDLATKNSAALLWLLVWMAGVSLSGMGLLASTLVRRAALATPLAFAIYILAWVFQLVISLGFPYSPGVSPGLAALFSLFPWSLLSKGFGDLASAAEGSHPGISWEQRYSYCQADTPSPQQQERLAYWVGNCTMPIAAALWILALQYAGYVLLALWLDNVLEAPHRPARHPLYFLRPSYWLPAPGQGTAAAAKALASAATAAEPTHALQQLCSKASTAQGPPRAAGTPDSAAQGQATPYVDEDVAAEALHVQQLCRYALPGHFPSLLLIIPYLVAASRVSPPEPIPYYYRNLGQWQAHCVKHPAEGLAARIECRRYLRMVEGGGSRLHPSAADLHTDDVERSSSWPGLDDELHTRSDHGGSNTSSSSSSSSSGGNGGGGATVLHTIQKGVVLFGLRKVYSRGFRLLRTAHEQVAVARTWLAIPPGECFALLGPNGAGKTTTISCLTGLASPTAGDALVAGHSISAPGGVERARTEMGVCFQFDVLWTKLTGREHMQLVAAMRGLSSQQERAQVAELLDQVQLTPAADVRAGSYSGGMRRRLSLALALLGSPSVVVLDEPTSGMDPLSRRAVWELLARYKTGRVLLLTTHSMEEADVLADRIAVFAAGQLRCLGSALHLKAKHGSGYRLSIGLQQGLSAGDWGGGEQGSSSPASGSTGSTATSASSNGSSSASSGGASSALEALVRKVLGGDVVLQAAGELCLQVLVPARCQALLPELLEQLQAQAQELGVADVQVGMAPLEEVFLQVAGGGEK